MYLASSSSIMDGCGCVAFLQFKLFLKEKPCVKVSHVLLQSLFWGHPLEITSNNIGMPDLISFELCRTLWVNGHNYNCKVKTQKVQNMSFCVLACTCIKCWADSSLSRNTSSAVLFPFNIVDNIHCSREVELNILVEVLEILHQRCIRLVHLLRN